jgi:leader peptidase (prepilin peptidase)/N-methyltransferase
MSSVLENFFCLFFVFVLGSSVGSFLNVVVYRIPAQLSILYPRSHCPNCSRQLTITQNIPILGWLRLKGCCGWCHKPIPIRYLLVEILTGLLFCFIFLRFGYTFNTISYWVLLSWLLALALIDIDTFTLPNVLLKFGLVVGLVFQVLQGWQNNDLNHVIFGAIFSAWMGLFLLDIIRIVGSFALQVEAMGDGDPKLAAFLGIWLGWQHLLLACFLACLLGAIWGIYAKLSGKLSRWQMIPFGPFLSLGGVLTIFWGNEIISTYVKLFFTFS